MLRPRKPSALLVKTLLFFILAMPLLQGRAKLDVIHLRNGDTVTGEIKSLDRGILSVSTDFMGTISIEWRGVLRVTSPQTFDVDVGGGARFGGSFPESGQDGVISMDLGGQSVHTLERVDIVRMGPLDKKLWDRLEARVDMGLDLTRANRSATYNLVAETTYRTEKGTTSMSYSSFLTKQLELDTLTRNDLEFYHERRFRDRWFAVGLGQFQQNEELGLELRSLGGGGLGRYLKRTNHVILRSIGGMAYTRERFREDESQGNIEGMVAFSVDYFRFEGKERDIYTRVNFWPSLSDFGRIRIDLTSGIRFELIKDLSWGFSLWNNYDSRPPTDDVPRNDFGISSTIGYKF